jgi:hypothetical protein
VGISKATFGSRKFTLAFVLLTVNAQECRRTTTEKSLKSEKVVEHSQSTPNELAACLISYLKSLGDASLIDEYFDTIPDIPRLADGEVSQACRRQVGAFKSEVMQQFVVEKNEMKCVAKAAGDDEKFVNILLKKRAIELIEHGVMQSFWNSYGSKKKKAQKEVGDEIEKNRKKYRTKCFEEEVESFLESIDDDDFEPEHDDAELLCIKRLLSRDGIINTEKININPKNLFIENEKCEEIFNKLRNEFYANLQSTSASCRIEISKREKYFENLVKRGLLNELNLSRSEIIDQKNEIIQAITEIYKKANEQC